MSLRQRVLKADCLRFQSEITADYGDTLSVFTLDCQASSQGDVTFQVLAPESIAGIAGTIQAGKGALTFDGTALFFPLLADGQLSPVSAPWLFLVEAQKNRKTGLRIEPDLLISAGAALYGPR